MKKKKKVAFKAPKRNLLTLLIAVGGFALIIFSVISIASYASLTKRMHEPFNTENVTYDLSKAEYIDGNDFDDFGFEFICSEFDYGKAKFKIKTYLLENQLDEEDKPTLEVESITVRICLTANYIDYCEYSQENKKHKLEDKYEEADTQSYTVTLIDFPAKVDAFPFDITVDEPTAYVYLEYKFKQQTSTGTTIKTKRYVLKYDYSEFNVQIGGISK